MVALFHWENFDVLGCSDGGPVYLERIGLYARNRVLDAPVYRGAVRGMSNHYLVEDKVRVAERWRLIRGVAVVRIRIKVRKLRRTEKVFGYQEKIRSGWEQVEGMKGGGVEEESGAPKEEGIRGRSRSPMLKGIRCRGGPRLGWMDDVRMALGERGMSLEQGRLIVLDRRRWELIVRSE